MAQKAPKRYGLQLAIPGATNEPHMVPGFPGLYRPDIPTPVGGEGDVMTLEQARDLIKAERQQVEDHRLEWDRFEAEQVEKGVRPHGPMPFGIATDVDGEVVYVDPPAPLELVPLEDVEAAEKAAADARIASVNGVADARALARASENPPAADLERIEDETAATKGA